MNTIIFHSKDIELASKIFSGFGAEVEPKYSHIRIHTDKLIDLNDLRSEHKLDFNYLPDFFDFNNASLFISDMDSTLINIECIDEIADYGKVKREVAAITEQAMNGEIDFGVALTERVALLSGLDINVLGKVYEERLQVNQGGKELIKFFRNKCIKTAVVSGGFTYFTDRLSRDLDIDYSLANSLVIEDGKLAGTIAGHIVDAASKANFVHELCEINSVLPEQVIVVGDGANDLEMMSIAGLSVAFHAKPYVLENSNVAINYSGLDKIIDFFDD
ncbi:MAG: phosphoserine phosphatase SerB [PS1 clade bacterium]|jgi:phosphoserine phosphatase